MTQLVAAPASAVPLTAGIFARPLRTTVRRWRFFLLALFALVVWLVLFVAPVLGRRYTLTAKVDLRMDPEAQHILPGLHGLPRAALQQMPAPAGVRAVVEGEQLQLVATAGSRDTAFVRMSGYADQFGTFLRHQAEEMLSGQATDLRKQLDKLSDDQRALGARLQGFQMEHPGILPEDPNSPITQADKLTARIKEKQTRLKLIADQISRLQDYKRGLLAVPPQPLPAAPAAGGAGAGSGANDPEILTLTAQLQLVNQQIEEQLKTRTEQHPYVRDLRDQQGALEKKLDAAKQRLGLTPAFPMSAGAMAVAPSLAGAAGTGTAIAPDVSLNNSVDGQLQSLQSESEVLRADIRTLTSQRDGLQQQVAQIMPARRQYEQMRGQLEQMQKDQAAMQAQLATMEKRLASSTAAPLIEASPLPASVNAGGLPDFPSVPLVYAVALVLGVAAAAAAAWWLHRADHAVHSPAEAATLEVPIVGMISEIRTPAAQQARQRWRMWGRPLATAGLAIVLLASALLAYAHLANPDFPGDVKRHWINAFSLGTLDEGSTP